MSEKRTEKQSSNIGKLAGKYLTFELAPEIYGLEILKVQEIIGIMKVTQVPKMPNFIKGIINLRGKVIPVVDLRLKFNLPDAEITDKTCIIVVQVAREDAKIVMGLVVDQVSEVLDIKEDQLEDAPSFGVAMSTDFLLGIGKIEDKVIMLINVDQVLSIEELSKMSSLPAD